jgi:hypothetical protein
VIEVDETRAVISQGSTGSNASSEDYPLVRSLRAILRQLDEEYERECENLRTTLPNSKVKDWALAISKARYLERRENYAREFSALLDSTG